MHTLHVREKADKDGILHLDIPVGQPHAEFDAEVVLHPRNGAASPGWPPGYSDLAGSITDDTFKRHRLKQQRLLPRFQCCVYNHHHEHIRDHS